MIIEKVNDENTDMELTNSATNDVLGALFGGDGDSLDKAGVYMLMDEIKNDSVRPAIEWILRNNLSTAQPENLTLIINSGGGSVTDADDAGELL